MKRKKGSAVRAMQPPDNFAMVEPGIYRSSLPHTGQHFTHLSDTLHVKTIVFLSQEIPTQRFKGFTEENDITFINLGLHLKQYRHFDNRGAMTLDLLNTTSNDSAAAGATTPSVLGSSMLQDAYSSNRHLREELIKEALQIVLNTNYHPVVIMCSMGVHLTGTVVACLRRLQHWSLTSILEEYRSFTGSHPWKSQGYRYFNEQFVELFDPDLISLPNEERLPSWFTFQVQMMKQDWEEYEQNKSQHAQASRIWLSKDDTRPAYRVYYFCTNGPLVSGKSEGDYTDKSLIEDEES